jgi:hypothetical protein
MSMSLITNQRQEVHVLAASLVEADRLEGLAAIWSGRHRRTECAGVTNVIGDVESPPQPLSGCPEPVPPDYWDNAAVARRAMLA